MSSILDLLTLPREVSAFERKHVARMNRLALFFLAAHLPVLPLVAVANGVPFLPVLGLVASIFAGALLAYRTLESGRAISSVMAFSAMCMGGTLVHAGQGPVQIEMHFYFFAVLAMLSIFGNPTVVLVGAGTVAAHHAGLWLLVPDSVFNYDAPLWVVAVHAGFVILETPVVCFLARNFFDNVIGLEKIIQKRTAELEARNRDVRVILDHVDQGLVTVCRDGVLSPERSAAIESWFGVPEGGATFSDYLTPIDAEAATWFQMGLETVLEGFMPLEVAIDQLPKRCEHDGSHYAFEYTPVLDADGELEKLLIVITDETEKVLADRAQAVQREVLTVFEKVLNDRAGFLDFYDEANRLFELVGGASGDDWKAIKRDLHTLKGNTAIFGLRSIADQCHQVETMIAEGNDQCVRAGLGELSGRWDELSGSIDRLLGNQQRDSITLDPADYENLLRRVIDGQSHVELAKFIAGLRLEPMELRLQRFADEARSIAERLEKGNLDVRVDGADLRAPRESLAGFWSSFTHVLRNAVDHGVEPPEQRAEAGKPETGTLELRSFVDGDDFVIEIADDGRGIDWSAVRAKADELGLDIGPDDELADLLFADGLSTRHEVTDTSGRGVGLAAVRAETENLGGSIEVDSESGKGTRMSFRFPANLLTDELELT
ncbi:MAG: ATP-binding protein [Planctomycetota bacterium]